MSEIFSSQQLLSIVSEYGARIVACLLIFLIGRKVAQWLSKLFIRAIGKTTMDETTASFLSSSIYIVLLLLVILAALGTLGVQTTSFIALLGAMGLAIGMALKDSFSSVGAGLLIVFFKPFKVKDQVEVAGVVGWVESINIFSTVLKTSDNKQIIIPNGKIVIDKIINYSAKKLRRIDLVVGVSYEDDLKSVKSLLTEIVESSPKILHSPAPTVAVLALNSSSVDFAVRVWAKTDEYWDVFFYLNETIKIRFDENKITIPYPQLTISNK
jgi:small conductance mechanosensitive channel